MKISPAAAKTEKCSCGSAYDPSVKFGSYCFQCGRWLASDAADKLVTMILDEPLWRTETGPWSFYPEEIKVRVPCGGLVYNHVDNDRGDWDKVSDAWMLAVARLANARLVDDGFEVDAPRTTDGWRVVRIGGAA